MADFPIIPVYQNNLLINGGFEIWQRGNGAFTAGGAFTADRWSNEHSGTDTNSISKDTTHNDVQGLACAACAFVLGTGAGASELRQKLEDYSQLRGQTVSFSVRVNLSTAVANAVRLGINDSVNGIRFGSYAAAQTGYQTITVTAPIASATTLVLVSVFFSASITAYLDNAMLVIGSQPLDYVPLTPADEMACCQRYYEVKGPSAGSSLEVRGFCAPSDVIVTPVFYQRKAVTPTLTKVGTWNVYNNGTQQPAVAAQDFDSCEFQITNINGTSAQVGAWNGNPGNAITVEANP